MHKTNLLLRSLVSYVNTLAYNLAAFLGDTSSLLRRNWDFEVKDSLHLVSTIRSEMIQDRQTVVTFDMESLLANASIKGTVWVAL